MTPTTIDNVHGNGNRLLAICEACLHVKDLGLEGLMHRCGGEFSGADAETPPAVRKMQLRRHRHAGGAAEVILMRALLVSTKS